MTSAATDYDLLHAADAYAERANSVEEDVSAWKSEMREATAAELVRMNQRAASMRTLNLALTGGACLIGLLAILISRSVLTRLRRLTSAILSLAEGEFAGGCAVPGREE